MTKCDIYAYSQYSLGFRFCACDYRSVGSYIDFRVRLSVLFSGRLCKTLNCFLTAQFVDYS